MPAQLNTELSQVFSKVDDIIFREEEDGAVSFIRILDADSFYRADGVAAELWKHLDGKSSLKVITQKLKKKTGLDDSAIKKATVRFARQFLEYGLAKKK